MTTRNCRIASLVVASTLLATGCSTASASPPATAPAAAGSDAMPVSTPTHTVTVAGIGAVNVTVSQRGTGRTFLLLHGGAGPASVAQFADLLSAHHHARVITPIHPGFGGTPRPEALHSVAELAAVYRALLDELDLHDVTVIGNSIGGWVASELALLHSPRVSRVVLVDATGIIVEGHPVADPFSMSLGELMTRSYYNPEAYRIDPSKVPEAQRTAMAANRAALAVYGGNPSVGDPTLRRRLARLAVPTLVLWGEADRIGDPDYGRSYAAAIPHARFQLLARAGHVPQIESPDQVRTAIWDFAGHRAE
jgi:pimeloyl-ACP methyl ester carboxylesterase